MATSGTLGNELLDRMRHRYETTDKKCPKCGYVDEAGNWTARTNGRRIVYHHVCPSCDAAREHAFDLRP